MNKYGAGIFRLNLRMVNDRTHLVIYGVIHFESFTEGHFVCSFTEGGCVKELRREVSVIYGGEFFHSIYGASPSKLTRRSM